MTNCTTILKSPNDTCMNVGGREGFYLKNVRCITLELIRICVNRMSLCMVESPTHILLFNDSHICLCGGEGFLRDYFKHVYQITHQLPYFISGKKTHKLICHERNMNGGKGNILTIRNCVIQL